MTHDNAAPTTDDMLEVGRDGDTIARNSFPNTTNSGRRARVVVLVLNALVCLVCTIASSYGLSLLQTSIGQTSWMIVQIGASTVLLGPMFLVAILGAWGPWPVMIRSTLFVAVLLLLALVQLICDYGLSPIPFSPATPTLITFLNRFSNWFCVLASTSLCLAMAGSLRRLRVGPKELPSIRVTILSIMLATALVGAMISGKMAIDTRFYHEVASSLPDQDIQGTVRSQVISQIAYAGPIASLMCCVSVAAAFYWSARLGAVALPACFGALLYSQNANASGNRIPDLAAVAVSGTACLVFACFWIALCMRVLHRSGWYCTRRIRA